ncbi:dethiobiotin synthase [Salinicola avicenniae]|uniref:dethiobiotin synthase n=1 Tax=Salinicola avicenniae TaxID=2916836 RepID=UPI0020743855|nr:MULTISPECIES: dethiobiotin synthase [unclassified Salinicola]
MTAYFLTGTDTDAGKTVIATGLLAAARRRGLTTAGGKPVASGCERTSAGLRNTDALAIQAVCEPRLDYAAINPVALAPAIAPHIAAREAGEPLTVARLAPPMRSLLADGSGFTVIEGAGGWRVPLAGNESLSDLARELGLPVILVVGVRLGAINHARLTLEAIQRDGLRVAGWVANIVEADMPRMEDNLDALSYWLGEQGGVPCLGVVPRLTAPTPAAVADLLDIDPLLSRSMAGGNNPQDGRPS